MIEFESPLGRRARRRLKREAVVWLTTVDGRRVPQPRPVWFHWNGDDVLIYSRPDGAKVRHIEANPHVALHFNSDEYGNDVVVFLGQARRAPGAVDEARWRTYLRKYRAGIADLEMTPAAFAEEYSIPLVVHLTSLRGF